MIYQKECIIDTIKNWLNRNFFLTYLVLIALLKSINSILHDINNYINYCDSSWLFYLEVNINVKEPIILDNSWKRQNKFI